MAIGDLIRWMIDFILHLDRHLGTIVAQYGPWTYLFLFIIIFLETGLVFTPFLPGDSMIFAAATMAGSGIFNIWILFFVFFAAAVLGDTCNYWIGKFIGLKLFRENAKYLNRKHLVETQKFFDKYGASSIVIGRFIPIIRTFVPFLAGVGKMKYWKFLVYNVIGAFLWVGLFTLGGYYFGGLKFVKDHFTLVLLLIISMSFIPAIWQLVRHLTNKDRHRKVEK